jgi:hypothetical protein
MIRGNAIKIKLNYCVSFIDYYIYVFLEKYINYLDEIQT